jgi:hypothetical protein
VAFHKTRRRGIGVEVMGNQTENHGVQKEVTAPISGDARIAISI